MAKDVKTNWLYILASSKGTLPPNLNLDRPKPGASSQVDRDITRILTLRSYTAVSLKIYVEFELRAFDGERVSEFLSLSKGPAAEVLFT